MCFASFWAIRSGLSGKLFMSVVFQTGSFLIFWLMEVSCQQVKSRMFWLELFPGKIFFSSRLTEIVLRKKWSRLENMFGSIVRLTAKIFRRGRDQQGKGLLN